MRIIFLSVIILVSVVQGYSQKLNFYQENEKVNLFAFIGEKISIIEFNPNENNKVSEMIIDKSSNDTIWNTTTSYCMDRAFIATYKVVQPVFNDIRQDTVTFTVYDHYGEPDFISYKNVLLYISAYDDKARDVKKTGYYHQKYQFDPVYKDSKDNWTAIFTFGSVSDYRDALNVKSFPITTPIFDKNISEYSQEYIQIAFPAPFYRIENNTARPLLGATLEDVFNNKKERVFKSLGLFD